MTYSILITGAAGYIGGSLLANFLGRSAIPFQDVKLVAAVRRPEHIQKLSHLDATVVQLDVTDEAAVMAVVLCHKIDMIINTANSADMPMVKSLLKALAARRRASGNTVWFIHSSVATAFSPLAGWTFGELEDSDPTLFRKDETLRMNFPVRTTNISIAEMTREYGITGLSVLVPLVYGKGTGEVRKLSVLIPAHIRTAIKHRHVWMMETDGLSAAVHISDVVALYAILVEKCLLKEPMPVGETGYYSAIAHHCAIPKWTQELTKAMYARGLVDEPEPQLWSSDNMAADYLGLPRALVRTMLTATARLKPSNGKQLGWQPKWDEPAFLNSLDQEIQDVIEHDVGNTSLFEKL